jgi:DNA-binding NtrC family response regulator
LDVDVRVIATTTRDLAAAVTDGTFRQDLYYRLNVLPIHVPPMRQRLEDIPLLADHFLAQIALREGTQPKQFDSEAIEVLKSYRWPGNVRELQNICERAAVLSRSQVIGGGVVAPWLVRAGPTRFAPSTAEPTPVILSGVTPSMSRAGFEAPSEGSPRPLEDVERDEIVRALGHFGGNRMRTAEALGIGVRTLGLKLKKWKEMNLVASSL